MDCRKNEKITALATVAACIVMALYTWRNGLHGMGICAGCDCSARLMYPFLHASLLHALINGYVLLAIVFRYDITIHRLLLAYAVAASVPADTLAGIAPTMRIPTVGLSGIVFFLLGSISFQVQRKAYFQSWMAFYLIVGWIMPGINPMLHLYSYIAGLIVALLNKPIYRK